MRSFFQFALEALQSGQRVFACFVAANRKGSPGTPAARMLLLESGQQVGTIGGGIMEKDILEAAAKALQSGEPMSPRLEELVHRRSDTEATSGLICGGAQSNVSLILEPNSKTCALIEQIVAACDVGGSLLIDANGPDYSGNDMNTSWELESPEATWSYRLNLVNQRRVAIFGGGHCGRALADQMRRLAYAVTVVEPRADVSTLEGLSTEISLEQKSFSEAMSAFKWAEKTHAVVMTHSMPTDIEALAAALKLPFKTVGAMGSSPKIARIRSVLKDTGFDDLQIGRVRAPIGLSFDSDTPEEIAVSIAAQILLER